METGGLQAAAPKKTSTTAKAIIYNKFGNKACYKVEEVRESTENGCPGLAIPQKGTCFYRCCLQLPEFSIVSETCKRKKEAEQSAAEKALEKLGIHPTENNLTEQEAWDDLVDLLSYLFSNEFLSKLHPLSCHFRSALRREGHLNGSVPVFVIAVYYARLNNLCKFINPEVESNPFLVTSLVLEAAARIPGSVSISADQLSIRRQNPYPPEIMQSLANEQSSLLESIWVEAIHIPYAVEKPVQPLTLHVSPSGYYLDVIAQELGAPDASKVSVSRPIGKASSEIRMYFAPKSYFPDLSKVQHANDAGQFEGSLNARASYLSGQRMYGDAILASIGFTWSSMDLFHEDVSLRTYHRLLIRKIPSGIYKMSREAILVSELPIVFTTQSNWRKGSFPREILCTFCRQHHISEPVFTTLIDPLESLPELAESCKKLNVTEQGKEEINRGGLPAGCREPVESRGTFRCEVKIFCKCQDLIIQCLPKVSFKKSNDAVQNAALKILSWLSAYFKNLDMNSEKLTSIGKELEVQFYPQHFFKEFALCSSVHKSWKSSGIQGDGLVDSKYNSQVNIMLEDGLFSISIEGPDSGVTPSSGSLTCISYSISLVAEGEYMKELLESSEEFEFEMGTGAVISRLEAVVTQMCVGQSAYFNMDFPPQELILAAARDSTRAFSLLSSRGHILEYTITLLHVMEPLEDRMEQALFSPPLSKQRVEYALQHIKKSYATSLVDFGCGSGSLLDSLLEYPTSLEKIVGVDISQKSLARAAKTLHSKLSTNSDAVSPRNRIKSALLYEGSIIEFDCRLYGFDIGTCLEVIEHMEEDQACLFGDVVLSLFCPRILIVSTPNYEYNFILQKSSLQSKEEDPEEKNQSQSCKFRNHDHKFEWTREQFSRWASDLAARHNYDVEFGGVGGVVDVEPGFASQIAVFSRGDNYPMKVDSTHHYEVIWEWDSTNRSKSAL